MKDNRENQIQALRLYIESLGVTAEELYLSTTEQVDGESKEWQILEFKQLPDGEMWSRLPSGKYTHPDQNEWRLEEMINGHGANVNNGQMVIWKVKRLSNGEVFTVGDRVQHAHWQKTDKIWTIEKFIVDGQSCYWLATEESEGLLHLNYLRTAPEPKKGVLLVTEDGVENDIRGTEHDQQYQQWLSEHPEYGDEHHHPQVAGEAERWTNQWIESLNKRKQIEDKWNSMLYLKNIDDVDNRTEDKRIPGTGC